MKRNLRHIAAAFTIALGIVGTSIAAAPAANAVAYETDNYTIPVAGHIYRLKQQPVGSGTITIHFGTQTAKVPSKYRLTFIDNHKHVIKQVNRDLYKTSYADEKLVNGQKFKTRASFVTAMNKALRVSETVAKKRYLYNLRIRSVQADLESNISNVYAYLRTLPAGTQPDFKQVKVVQANGYKGSASIAGTTVKDWQVTVRDTTDGYGEFYDNGSGSGNSFRF